MDGQVASPQLRQHFRALAVREVGEMSDSRLESLMRGFLRYAADAMEPHDNRSTSPGHLPHGNGDPDGVVDRCADAVHDHGPPARTAVGAAKTDRRLRDALEYIHNHMHERIAISSVIRHIGVSRRWLEYAFREAVGTTPYQYIRTRRLEYVRRLLLEEPHMRIHEIAERTGFSNAKQLTMAFHRDYGMSPRDYRRTHQGLHKSQGFSQAKPNSQSSR